MTTISIVKLRKNLASIINTVAKKEDRYVVKKAEIPVGILVNYDEYKTQLEELEDLKLACDPEVVERIKEAKKDKKEGRIRPLAEFAKELGL